MENKQIQSTSIFILLLTVAGMVIYYTWFEHKIPTEVAIPILVLIVPFAIGLYTSAASPEKAQLIGAMWSVFISVVSKKMNIQEAMKQIEIILVNGVNLWNILRQKSEDLKKKLDGTNPET